MRIYLSALFLALPGVVFAAGGESEPTPTETTTSCSAGMVYDASTKSCVAPKESSLSDDVLYQAAREFAYAGQLDNAQTVLAAMSDQSDDRVLTYWGFTHRKMGNTDLGMDFYARALEANPDNILTRSYMGQALMLQGDMAGAWDQLREIEVRGGAGSWAEKELRLALLTGVANTY